MLTWCSSAVNFSFPFCFAASRTRSSPLRPLPRHGVRLRVRLWRVLLGQRPSLHNLRRRLPAFVRLLRRYYAAVRLPPAVHGGLMAHRLLLPARLLPRAATGSPGSRAWSFSACLGSSTPRGRASLALSRMRVVAFRTG